MVPRGLKADEIEEITMDYTVLIHQAEEGGYWTEVPSLPGCFSQGDTVEQALVNTKDAIECHLVGLRAEGIAAPGDYDVLIARVNVAA